MADYSFHIYSFADLGAASFGALLNSSLTVAASGTPDVIVVSDNDAVFDRINLDPSTDQALAFDLIVDGVTVATAGQLVSNHIATPITNTTTGESGYLILIRVNGVDRGVTSTIALNPGDQITTGGTTYLATDYDGLDGPVCFAAGTLVDTPAGPRRVEQLRPGDLVHTRDNGPQVLRWIGQAQMLATGWAAPVVFAPGALGNTAALALSPQHRVLISGWRASVLFGEPEVLVHAIDLVNGSSIRQRPGGRIVWVHLLFDAHQIVRTSGLFSESYHPAHDALDGFGADTRAEILRMFPELASGAPPPFAVARPVLARTESRLLTELA